MNIVQREFLSEAAAVEMTGFALCVSQGLRSLLALRSKWPTDQTKVPTWPRLLLLQLHITQAHLYFLPCLDSS